MPHGKACTCCQRLLLAEHFRPVAAMRDGLDSWCKDCQRRSTRQWRAANRGRENAARRKPRAVMRCEHCGTAFETARKDQRYCGRHAKAAARLGRTIGKPRHWYAGTCIHCGQGFIDNQPDRNVCSPRCGRRYSASIRRARKRAAFVEQVVRPKVYARDGWRCQLCGQPVQRDKVVPHPDAPTLDHIVPLAAGGDHSYANTQLAHFRCNYLKGDRGGGEQLRLVA
jgi:5-methylcytosine-specific restriction endonuclease McrA